jgi:hypothetical protein
MMNRMAALPDPGVPGSLVSPSAEETREYSARRLLDRMVASARRGEVAVARGLAQNLRDEYPDAGWGILGIYWYWLLARQAKNALVCEQIVLRRFKSLDQDQRGFYRTCLQMQQALQETLCLPCLESDPQSDEREPAVACTQGIHVVDASRFQDRIEKETDDDNKKTLASLDALKNKKSLHQVNPAVFDVLKRLQNEQPNMRSAIEQVRAELHARVLVNAPARLPPLLLCGCPGVGKTRFVFEIVKAMGLPYVEVSVAGSPDAFRILGLSRYWGRSGAGLIARSFVDHDAANPVFLFDEIDKAGRSEHGSPHDALLGLLEERTACEFRDAFIDVPMNIANASFIATANSIDAIPAPLLSRFVVLNIPDLNEGERLQVSRSIYMNLCGTEPYGGLFAEGLPENIASLLAKQKDFSPRMARQLLRQAMQKACLEITEKPHPQSVVLSAAHLNIASPGKRHMGFVVTEL